MASGSRKSSKTKRLLTAAIDLGTTYSGWAYATQNAPNNVHANQVWYAGGGTLASHKTPSCVLLTPKKEFNSFGYDAETKFAALAEEDQHHGWYYFWRFKMALFDDHNLNRFTEIEDISGKKMPALVIFAHAIRYLKDNFLCTIHKRVPNILDTDVDYVLTVPAIWNDMAKRFMRQAAIQAGIKNDQLTIALEPEAASIWCQGIRTEVQRTSDTVDLGISAVGTQYMIVDLGGGTADITVHERRSHNTLLEIHKATGGAWGGTEVDNNFIQLLADVVGHTVWKNYEIKELEDILDIQRDFETKKRNISANTTGKMVIRIPSRLKTAYEQSGKSIADVKGRFHDKLEWKDDKMRIDVSYVQRCFDGPVKKVIEHVEGILSEIKMCNVKKIMLVGGFAESPYVQEKFKRHFPTKQIIIPPECGLAVLKGAVVFGHDPTVVTTRIARYTYGIAIAVPFDCKKHSGEKLVNTDAGPLCRDSFWKAVEIGQEIKTGHQVSRIGKAVDDYQQKIILEIVKSNERNPMYTTEHGCEVIGSVVVPMDSTLKADDNCIDEIFVFGGTELVFNTMHKTTGDIKELNLDL